MKKVIGLISLSLILAIPACAQGISFLDLVTEASTSYGEGEHLAAKAAIMRAEAVLNMEIADLLREGAIPFGVFQDAFSKLSGAQFKRWASDFKGKVVSWDGQMLEAEKKWYGEYEIWVDMDEPEISDELHDVSIWVGSEKGDFILALSKGDRIGFQGEIEKITKVSGRLVVVIKKAKFQQ